MVKDAVDVTWYGILFQNLGPAMQNAQPLTVDSLTNGMSRHFVLAEQRASTR